MASVPVVLPIRSEIVRSHVFRDLVPQKKALDEGVVVVKACVDACAFYLAFKFMNVLEVVVVLVTALLTVRCTRGVPK